MIILKEKDKGPFLMLHLFLCLIKWSIKYLYHGNSAEANVLPKVPVCNICSIPGIRPSKMNQWVLVATGNPLLTNACGVNTKARFALQFTCVCTQLMRWKCLPFRPNICFYDLMAQWLSTAVVISLSKKKKSSSFLPSKGNAELQSTHWNQSFCRNCWVSQKKISSQV